MFGSLERVARYQTCIKFNTDTTPTFMITLNQVIFSKFYRCLCKSLVSVSVFVLHMFISPASLLCCSISKNR